MDIIVSLCEGEDGRWEARGVDDSPWVVRAATREACLRSVRRKVAAAGKVGAGKAGRGEELTTLLIEVLPRLAGVAEAARIMGWDKRRVITYIDRGRFPSPVQALASGRVWVRSEVERFGREWHGRQAGRGGRPAGTKDRR